MTRATTDRDTDTTRFTELYKEHRAPLLGHVRATARRMHLTGRVDAEGVVQETFADAYESWATLDRPERWIYTVARRKVLHHVRSAAAERRLQERLQPTAYGPSESQRVLSRMRAEEAVIRILALPGNQRDATYLHHVQGWTGPEIARHLGIATGTVHAHIHRGVRRVRLGLADAPRHGNALVVVIAVAVGVVLAALSGTLRRMPSAMPYPGAHSPQRTGDGSALDVGMAGTTNLGITAILLIGGVAALLVVRRRSRDCCVRR